MADVFGLKIEGADLLALKFAMADKAISENMAQEIYRQATRVEARAKEILNTIQWVTINGLRRHNEYFPPESTVIGHIDYGKLRDSIQTKSTVTKSRMEAEIGTWMSYAPYVEALPDGGFLFRAYWEKKDEVIKNLQNMVIDTILTMRG